MRIESQIVKWKLYKTYESKLSWEVLDNEKSKEIICLPSDETKKGNSEFFFIHTVYSHRNWKQSFKTARCTVNYVNCDLWVTWGLGWEGSIFRGHSYLPSNYPHVRLQIKASLFVLLPIVLFFLYHTQSGLLLCLSLKIHFYWGSGDHIGCWRIKNMLAACKASTLPVAVFLKPQYMIPLESMKT